MSRAFCALFQKLCPIQHRKNNLLYFIYKILLFHIHVFNPPGMYFCLVFSFYFLILVLSYPNITY